MRIAMPVWVCKALGTVAPILMIHVAAIPLIVVIIGLQMLGLHPSMFDWPTWVGRAINVWWIAGLLWLSITFRRYWIDKCVRFWHEEDPQ